MAGGRPRLFSKKADLEKAISLYFETEEKYTITGLAYHLGFESRQSFYDYEKDGRFSYTIKRARLRIEAYYETKTQGAHPAGPIFVLKNLGWKERQEHAHEFEQPIFKSIELDVPADDGAA